MGNTVGERNNNPGNLVASPLFNWQGQTGQDSNGFCIFDTPENGIRALSITLQNYYNFHNLDTVQDIITRYAPPSANPTAAYIANVAAAMGVDPSAPLNMSDPATLTAMITAIINQENGGVVYDASDIAATVSASIGAA